MQPTEDPILRYWKPNSECRTPSLPTVTRPEVAGASVVRDPCWLVDGILLFAIFSAGVFVTIESAQLAGAMFRTATNYDVFDWIAILSGCIQVVDCWCH